LTPSGPYVHGALVRFVRGGVPILEKHIPGTLLEVDIPSSVTFARTADGIDIIENSDPMLECCGRLALPWMSGRNYGVDYLHVPPPPPFSAEGVSVMWEARNRLRIKHRPPTSADAAWSTLSASSLDNLSWIEMRSAVEAAVALLSAWPTDPVRIVKWAPVESTRGRILVRDTERSKHLEVMGGRVPVRVASAGSRRIERKLTGISVISALVADRISSHEVFMKVAGTAGAELSDLFRRVSMRSRPNGLSIDPPASTWPPRMRVLYSSCVRLLTQLEDAGAGESHAPLSELWELYEGWVTESILAALTRKCGEALRGESGIGWRWGAQEEQWVLLEQADIPSKGPKVEPLNVLGTSLIGAVGASQPDVLLAHRKRGVTSLVVVDAKKRKKKMNPEDLTVSASKYLWNIRDASNVLNHALDAVFLAAPLGGPSSADPSGRSCAIFADPSEHSDFAEHLIEKLG